VNIGIQGIGVLGGFGCGLEDLTQALLRPRPLDVTLPLETVRGRIEIPALRADTQRLGEYLPKKALRRIDHYTRMALLGAFMALDDARCTDRQRLGIIVATGYGATCNTFDFQDSLLNHRDPCGSPTKFSNSVHNAAAAHIAIFLKAMGPNLSLSHFDMSMPSALATAVQWLAEKRVDTVLVGGVDEFCKVLGYYYYFRDTPSSQKWFPPQTPPSNYEIVGEGACFFVLKREGDGDNAYGSIEAVRMGRFNGRDPERPRNAAYIIAADGYSECDHRYRDWLTAGEPVAAYTQAYGGIPIGMGFDLAIAALIRRNNTYFTTQNRYLHDTPGFNRVDPEMAVDARRICCLKLGTADSYGWVALGR
jgi:3-oxoacyl-[acyl-carrier-protein] synthase II